MPGTITVRPGLPAGPAGPGGGGRTAPGRGGPRGPGGRAGDSHDDFWSEADATGRAGDEPGDSATGTTSGGLTRRVRGAQMPNRKAPRIRRRAQEPDVPAPAADDGTPPDPGDVYGFLTSFTAGVQRGLDDALRRDDD